MNAVVQTNHNIADMLAHLGLIWNILPRGQIKMTQGGKKKKFHGNKTINHIWKFSLPLKVTGHIFHIAALPLK